MRLPWRHHASAPFTPRLGHIGTIVINHMVLSGTGLLLADWLLKGQFSDVTQKSLEDGRLSTVLGCCESLGMDSPSSLERSRMGIMCAPGMRRCARQHLLPPLLRIPKSPARPSLTQQVGRSVLHRALDCGAASVPSTQDSTSVGGLTCSSGPGVGARNTRLRRSPRGDRERPSRDDRGGHAGEGGIGTPWSTRAGEPRAQASFPCCESPASWHFARQDSLDPGYVPPRPSQPEVTAWHYE